MVCDVVGKFLDFLKGKYFVYKMGIIVIIKKFKLCVLKVVREVMEEEKFIFEMYN